MKLNKDGWGTLEMLLLSAGILIALFVAVFFIHKLYGSFDKSLEKSQYINMETNLANAAKKYIIDNNLNIENELTIYSDTLEVLGYIDSIKDKEGYPCTGYVVVTKIDSVNSYKSFIICKNYKTVN